MNTIDAVDAFLTSRTSKGLASTTLRWYRGVLEPFAQMYPGELPDTPEKIEKFIGSCRSGDERRHGYFRALRAFYRWCKRRYKVVNPMADEGVEATRRKRKQPKDLSPQEIRDVLRFPHAPRVKAALLLLFDTGMRVGEAWRVAPADFTLTEWGYVVRVTKDGKTGEHLVPVSAEVYQAILKYLPFDMSLWWFRRLISRAFTDARVKGSGISARHSFGSLWDGDELTLQKIMGHSNLSTTLNYRAIRTERMSSQHYQHSPLRQMGYWDKGKQEPGGN